MAQEADGYIQSHELLSTWNDELEYLGYILAEIVDPHGLDQRGFVWHQAADLPAIDDILKQASKRPNSRLKAVLNKTQRKKLRHLMLNARRIRNMVAHHQTPCEKEMRDMHRRKDELSGLLQSAIGLVASKFDIDHVNWYADLNLHNQPTGNPRQMARISLRDESLVSQRQEALAISLNRSHSSTSHQRRKATEEGREQHRRTYIAAQRRKAEKALRNAVVMEEQTVRKLKEIDSRYYAKRQQRLDKINRTIQLMRDEEREWKHRRSQVKMPGICSHDNILAAWFLAFLAITSPFWLCCVFVHKLWATFCKRFR
ncbi:hypothetical protein PISL3812_02861 [Talaromyces islandicus]|uniref:Uncharacterized protein n=1 Tax=Talaromyces islandicus TaxID=28573 RepID=A0A0U1LR29_TALIS|nr:hypothetical protein PISL3812_02861 [Talaromyces islandicus]